MFTPPSVNQIAKAYQGNPAPLGQKVEADKQRNGGIPSDLRQLLALNDITQGRNAMGIQQALQIPTNMPTVAEDLQERARQALQARMMQQAQEEQSNSGQPNVVPMGTPRPPMQAQGLDSLESNVGEGYAEGGIIGFDDGGGVSDQQIKDWFAANQGASDTDIYGAMKQYNVGTDQLTKAMGFDPTEVSRRYDVQARADIFKPERSRSEQESMVNEFYQDKGLTPDQLGQTNFGYPVDTRESRSENRPFTNMYQDYQKDLANTGRYDAPAGSQFRAKAVYMPDSIGNRGSIKLIDSRTGQELTNLGGANSIGNTRDAFDLMDKFAVDPASYRQAASQMYESMGKPDYMQDDYKYLTGYKPRDVAGATDTYLRTPLAKATVDDLSYDPQKDANNRFTKDTRTNIDWLGSTQRLLMSKGMGASEASNYLHQFIPVSGLVDWDEIHRSKDPVKAIIGTLNHLQSKGVTNLDPNRGPLSKIGQTRFDASGKKLPALYTGEESLRSLGLKGLASGGSVQHFQSKGSVQDPEVKKEEEATSAAGDFIRALASALGGGVQRTMDYGKLKREKEDLEGGLLNAFRAFTPTQKAERQKRAELLAQQMSEVGEKGEIAPTYPKAGAPTFKTYAADTQPDAAAKALAAETSKLFNLAATPGAEAVPPTKVSAPRPPAATQATTRVNADSAPMPGGLQGLASSLATPGLDYQRKILNQDENVIAAARRALYDKEVGARDLSIYDKTAAELEARKQKLNAPKAGYDALMEYLEQIAIGGGRTSAESGSLGASRQRALQKERLSQQDVLMDKILELGAKKSDAMFAEKKGMFDLTQAERDRVIKEKLDAAKQLGLSEDKTRELIEQGLQKELDRKNQLKAAGISAGNRDDLLGRALLIKKDNPTISMEEAIKRASVATYAGQLTAAEGKSDTARDQRIAKIRENYGKTMKFLSPDSPMFKRQQTLMEQEIADERGKPSEGAGLPSALPAKKPEGVTVTKIGS